MNHNKIKIEYTEDFKNDLYEVIDYIKYKLKNVNAANALLSEVKSEIEKRSYSPDSYKTLKINNKFNDKFYSIKIRNFYILYTVNKIKNVKIMLIQNFIYAKRNFISALN